MKIKYTHQGKQYFINTDNITRIYLDMLPDYPTCKTDLVELFIQFSGTSGTIKLSESSWKKPSKLVELHDFLQAELEKQFINFEGA